MIPLLIAIVEILGVVRLPEGLPVVTVIITAVIHQHRELCHWSKAQEG